MPPTTEQLQETCQASATQTWAFQMQYNRKSKIRALDISDKSYLLPQTYP